jgi:hypothetical protein
MVRLNEDYNGWKNWGTWYMSMLLGDDSYTMQEMVNETNGDVYELSNRLKQEAEYIIFGSLGYDNDSIMAEYAEWGFQQIDFYELAETFLLDYEPDRDEDYDED